MRTCSVDACDRPHVARGLCARHWKRQYGKPTRYPITCVVCGAAHVSARPDGKFCSDDCKGKRYARHCDLPADHPVRVAVEADRRRRWMVRRDALTAAPTVRASFVMGWCTWCGAAFCTTGAPALTCSARCKRKIHRQRRISREQGMTDYWTWSEFMRIAARFNFCCAYCGTKPDRLDPDHVIPLSRGGPNVLNNLLPTCMPCNSDKRDLLLGAWAADRERRKLPPRMTSWLDADARYWHLTYLSLAA